MNRKSGGHRLLVVDGRQVGALVLLLVLFAPVSFAEPQRLKDISSVSGVRSNHLLGYGLVVGLDGTGDSTSQTPFTIQSFRNMLGQFGIQIPANLSPQLENVAAVSVHSELPAFAKPGQNIDVTVSSLGNAESLRGGTLLLTQLRGADGQVYALTQGNLVVGGFGAEGADGSSVTVNVPSVGRIPNGGTVERASPDGFSSGEALTFNLHRGDFTTALRVAESINDIFGPQVATTLDATSIKVRAPSDSNQRVSFMAALENLEVEPASAPAKVIINSRTGTIVIGELVQVTPAAVTHGSLSVTISESFGVSQPEPFSDGETVVVPESDLEVVQDQNRMFVFAPGVNLQEIVAAVNEVGAAPGDLMAILEALKEAGALRAQIVVI